MRKKFFALTALGVTAASLGGVALAAPQAAPAKAHPSLTINRTISDLSPELAALAKNTTWREGCPVPLSSLRQVTVPYTNFSGVKTTGLIVVHQDIASDTLFAFQRLQDQGFRIRSVKPIEYFGGNDDKSMAADNTSGFNCRFVPHTTKYSNHSWGKAIDINTVENPYVTKYGVSPVAGTAFTNRSVIKTGMIGPKQVALFKDVRWFQKPWVWGGDWVSGVDYQHFEHK